MERTLSGNCSTHKITVYCLFLVERDSVASDKGVLICSYPLKQSATIEKYFLYNAKFKKVNALINDKKIPRHRLES